MNRSGRRPMEKPAESTPSDGRPARKPNPGTMRLPGSVAEVRASPPGPEIGVFRPRRHPGRPIHRRPADSRHLPAEKSGARDRPDSRRTQETAPRRIPCAVPRPPSSTGLGRRVIGNSEGLPGGILRRIKERGEHYEGCSSRRLTRPTHRNHVRGRDDRGRQAIPPGQRSPARADAPRRTRAPVRRIHRTRGAR